MKGKAYEKTAILLTACKCMSGRLMALASYWGGGYAGLRRGRTHSACAGEAEAQGIQRLPKKIITAVSSRGCFCLWHQAPIALLFSCSSPFLTPSLCSVSSGPSSHRSAISVAGCGTAQASDPCYPAKVRRFTSAAALKTQTRCRSRWGRLHCLRVALDMLP